MVERARTVTPMATLHQCTCGHQWMAPMHPDKPCPKCSGRTTRRIKVEHRVTLYCPVCHTSVLDTSGEDMLACGRTGCPRVTAKPPESVE